MQLRCLVIDDEPLARKRVVNLLGDFPLLSLIGECSSGKKAIASINELQPDLIFLDINLNDMTGIKVLEQIEVHPKPLVIFITAYEEYALQAFEYFAFDYILKPFKDERFAKSLNKAIAERESKITSGYDVKLQELLSRMEELGNAKVSGKLSGKFPIRSKNKTLLVNHEDILYVLASGYYIEVYTGMERFVIRDSLTNIMAQLGPNFIRIHRSSMINMDMITELSHSDFGELDVKMVDKKLLRVSKSFKKDFLEKMGIS
jgi:Response regulator of the LytR/AlgR family